MGRRVVLRGTGHREEVARVDSELFRVARSHGQSRLELGELLARLGHGVRELGFANLRAYAQEVCGRGPQWAAETRSVARRLVELPRMRAALSRGEIGWSMAELLVRHATPSDELLLLTEARSRTVRAMRVWLKERCAQVLELDAPLLRTVTPGEYDATPLVCGEGIRLPNWRATHWAEELLHEAPPPQRVSMRLRLPAHEALALELAEKLVTHLGKDDDFLEPLLAEAHDSMLNLAPSLVFAMDDFDVELMSDRARAARREKLREVEERDAEALIPAPASAELTPPDSSREDTPNALHDAICGVVAKLDARDLYLGKLGARLLALGGWRVMGYASETQYCRERLGIARSTLRSKVRLVSQSHTYDEVVRELESGALTSSAAELILRVATWDTESAWVERAKRRTIKHLKEEVRAVELARRYGGAGSCPGGGAGDGGVEALLPPTAAELEVVRSVERDVLSGELLREALDDTPPRTQARDARPDEEAQSSRGIVQTSESGDVRPSFTRLGDAMRAAILGVQASGSRTVGVTLYVRDDVALHFRRLRHVYERHDIPGSFVDFLVFNFFRCWVPVLGQSDQWEHIYRAHNYECTSPVCESKNVTLHHIEHRSQGGTDDPSNLTTPCAFCHLEGHHAGRLHISGTAEHTRWELGRDPVIVVDGRDRLPV